MQLQEIVSAKLELEQQIVEKDTKLTELSAEMEIVKAECPNTSGVLATMESDKLAASKSMTQNQELKKQLDEIQRAYIQVVGFKLFSYFDVFSNCFLLQNYFFVVHCCLIHRATTNLSWPLNCKVNSIQRMR